MKTFVAVALSFSLLCGVGPALADVRGVDVLVVAGPSDGATGKPSPKSAPSAPSSASTMDQLFERLVSAKSEMEARVVAGSIQRRWLRSGSDTADLLMSRAIQAMTTSDHELAIELLDRVLALEPDWAEAWNKRATVFYMMGDQTRAMADIRETLRREPRHFGALFGLAAMLNVNGDKKPAYEAFRRAHAIYPLFPPVNEALERLRPEVEGQDI